MPTSTRYRRTHTYTHTHTQQLERRKLTNSLTEATKKKHCPAIPNNIMYIKLDV